MAAPVAALSRPSRRPYRGPVAALLRPRRRPIAAPSLPSCGPVAALSRPRCRPIAAPSPPSRGPVTAVCGPIAARSGPAAAPRDLVATLSLPRRRPLAAPVAALLRPRRRPFAAPLPLLSGLDTAPTEPPSSGAAEPPSRPATEPPDSRAAEPPSHPTAEPPSGRAAQQPSRPKAKPPSRRAARQLSRRAAPPPSRPAAESPSRPTAEPPSSRGRAIDFEVWVDDLQLFLQCDSAGGLSLFDLTSGASLAPPAIADSTVRSQWATRDAGVRLAVHRHLPTTERAHFSQYKSAQTLYDAVVARYSSPATAALSRLMLPYLFLDLAAFPTVADLITHLRTSDTRYRVTRLPDSLRVVRDHFLSVCPTTLTIDLLEKGLLVAEKSIVAVGASRGDPRTPIFEGCSPSPLLPSIASAAAADLVGFESVGAASAPSGRRRTGKGKGGKGAGGAGGGGGGGGGGSGGGGGGGGSGGGGGGGGGSSGGVEAAMVAEGAKAAEVAEEAELEEAAEAAAAAAVVERVPTLRRGVAQMVVRARAAEWCGQRRKLERE
ncbi:unnamed protein product [Closterium sp. NIES-64]|nr:unnamed protein product [Closterium sp. NIES-64]